MRPRIHGMLAEFGTPTDLVAAVRRTTEAGYRRVDACTPFPIEELEEALRLQPTRLPLLVLLGGILGGAGGYFMQYYAAAIAYPLNIGGRPLHSWPAFIPITFETTVLVAAFTAVFAMLALNGLPMPYHPVFNVPRFAMASRDQFFLVIEATDPQFDEERTRQFLLDLQPHDVWEVPH
ncbi:MAG: DUF3341 domain-containing protein [Gemmataceae bacterium]|nr:DUF3341 domain-containing protein [Gemmataceae bacterium]